MNFKVNTEGCIGCSTCALVAPTNFAMNENKLAFVKKQPESQDEIEECKQALEICPVSVISN
jgi:ferredoxin